MLLGLSCIFFFFKCSKNLWGQVVFTTCHLINKVSSQVLGLKSPLEMFTILFPRFNISHKLLLEVFGCSVFVHIHAHHKGKLDPRALKCVFIEYSSTQKGNVFILQ